VTNAQRALRTPLAEFPRRFGRGYNHPGGSMDTTEIIQTIDAEIARLEKARAC
jgi:hypothetical protein